MIDAKEYVKDAWLSAADAEGNGKRAAYMAEHGGGGSTEGIITALEWLESNAKIAIRKAAEARRILTAIQRRKSPAAQPSAWICLVRQEN